jgi:N4-gp56 family major capsid protein
MGLGTNHVTLTIANNFIPELWSDEVVAAYQSNLVLANLIKTIDWVGKKGDTVHIPSPARGAATAKAASTQVSFDAATNTAIDVVINKHYNYSKLYEDIADIQSLNSMRAFYTDDAGYQLAKQVDSDLIALGSGFQGGSGTAAYNTGFSGADGTTAYVDGSQTGMGALTDAAIRRSIQRLDDIDVPQSNRFLVIPPTTRNTMMGLARFTEQAFVGEAGSGNTIRNGRIGDVYGVPVYVTSNCATTTTGSNRVVLMGHRDCMVLIKQLNVRVQSDYILEYLGTAVVSDTIYGLKELRDGAAVALIVTP